MDILRLALRYLHLIGFALLFGGFLARWVARELRVSVVMRAGLGTMIITGLLLALPFPRDVELDYVKLGVKLGIAFVIGATMGVAIKRGEAVNRGHFAAIGVLALINAAVAVFWR